MIKSSLSPSPPISSSPGDPIVKSTFDPLLGPLADREAQDNDSRDAKAPFSIDLTGELCPFTFVRTKLALEDMALGDVLRVVVDHEPATRNIPRSATEWGQEMIAVTRLTQHTWAIDLRKRVR